MAVPRMLTTAVAEETVAGVTYHIEGAPVPVLHLELGLAPVYFEPHLVLWKEPHVKVEPRPIDGAFKRVLAGLPVFMTQAAGPGRIAFSRDGVGYVFAQHLRPGDALDVPEHQFLAATDSVDCTYQAVKGVSNALFGGRGLFLATFSTSRRDGLLWLYGYGNVFEAELALGEQLDIKPGGWVYKSSTVALETTVTALVPGWFGGSGLTLNRFTGPGRVGLQSLAPPPQAAK